MRRAALCLRPLLLAAGSAQPGPGDAAASTASSTSAGASPSYSASVAWDRIGPLLLGPVG